MADNQRQANQPVKMSSLMGYQLMPTHPLLAPYIESIEIQLPHMKTAKPIIPYRVLPSLSVVVGFQYQGELNLLNQDGSQTRLQRSGITGVLTNYKSFQSAHACTKTILVKFYPWALSTFFNEPAEQFTNESLGLADIIKTDTIRHIEEKLQGVKDPVLLSDIVQQFFIQLYKSKRSESLRQSRIIHIAQNLSKIDIHSIKSFAHYHGYSTRSLERHFKSAIGITPKKFILIARFQKVLNLLIAGTDWNEIAERFDYYDQSHFIKDIKQFTGLAPSQLIQSSTSS